MPQTLLYYDLFLAARSAPSQLRLHDNTYSGYSCMMEYSTEQVQHGASEASPLLAYIKFRLEIFNTNWALDKINYEIIG